MVSAALFADVVAKSAVNAASKSITSLFMLMKRHGDQTHLRFFEILNKCSVLTRVTEVARLFLNCAAAHFNTV
jgi:hypothetical protein